MNKSQFRNFSIYSIKLKGIINFIYFIFILCIMIDRLEHNRSIFKPPNLNELI